MVFAKLLLEDRILTRHLNSHLHVRFAFEHAPLVHREQCLIKLRLILESLSFYNLGLGHDLFLFRPKQGLCALIRPQVNLGGRWGLTVLAESALNEELVVRLLGLHVNRVNSSPDALDCSHAEGVIVVVPLGVHVDQLGHWSVQLL